MIRIAILGLGTVGSGTADLLTSHKDIFAARVGDEVDIKYILDIRDLPDSPYHDLIVHDYSRILEDDEVQLVAEVIGGLHPAYEFTRQALEKGKHVVTSNKELVATHGDELLRLAAEHGVSYLFEASVGGGIPIIRPLSVDMQSNDVLSIKGIMNGTTNYILTRMFQGGVSFEIALAEAQKLGYAEANPAADVEGMDACRKICILAAVAFGKLIPAERVYTEGITAIRTEDVAAARAYGAEIKLLGRAVRGQNGDFFMMVAPFFVPTSSPLAHVSGVFNAISVKGSAVGDVMFYGAGAGALPTASAVVSDILTALKGNADVQRTVWERADDMPTDFGFFACRHFLALKKADATAAHVVFGNCQILPSAETDELWVVTESMTENHVRDSIARLETIGAQPVSHIRILD